MRAGSSRGPAIVMGALVCAWAAAGMVATPAAQRHPTYATDIAPIVLARCATCHRPGQAAPFPLLSYDDVRAKGKEIVEATRSRRMPPWLATQGPGFPPLQDDRRLTDRQIAAIARWVDDRMPSGNLRRAPAPEPYPLSWPLGTPDVTLELPSVIAVPASAPSESWNVVVPLHFPADVWVSAVDYESGRSGVVRHARFFLAPPDLIVAGGDVLPGVGGLLGSGSLENYSDRLFAAARGLVDLGGWVPGFARRFLPDDLAIRVPARSNVIVQLHLQSRTEDAVEDGRLAIYFAKPLARRAVKPVDVPPAFGIAAGLSIPAGEPRYVVKDALVLPVDVEAVGARAHAHVLARALTMTAALPDGTTRGLLRIDRWDVDWPDSYFFATPIRLPKGTTIRVEIVYDNSADNPRNLFSPPRQVGWGRLSVGEMGSMTLLIAAPTNDDAEAIDDAMAKHLREQLLRKSPAG
jgi:mono/diheme cytochrome c family protein